MLQAIGKALGINVMSLAVYTVIALLAAGSLWGYGAMKYRAGKAAGIAQERSAWEDARRKLLAQIEAGKRAAQAKIDAAEREYLDGRTASAVRISALEDAIAAGKADDDRNQNPACPAHYAISRGVSRSLNAIGR